LGAWIARKTDSTNLSWRAAAMRATLDVEDTSNTQQMQPSVARRNCASDKKAPEYCGKQSFMRSIHADVNLVRL
jgi:hypothetical protein